MTSYNKFCKENVSNDIFDLGREILKESGFAYPYNSFQIDTKLSSALDIANVDWHPHERFLHSLKISQLNVYQFAEINLLEKTFTKRLTYLRSPNPRLSTLAKWLLQPMSASIFFFVFFPRAHNSFIVRSTNHL